MPLLPFPGPRQEWCAQAKEDQAEVLHEEAMALSAAGEIDAALKMYREAQALDLSRPETHYNIGLIHKYRSGWEESFRYNKPAVELASRYPCNRECRKLYF